MKPLQPSRLPRLPNQKPATSGGFYDQENTMQDGFKQKSGASSSSQVAANGKSSRPAISNAKISNDSEPATTENQLVLIPIDPLSEFESVLNEKIVSKGKFDYKGKSEVFAESIRKLKSSGKPVLECANLLRAQVKSMELEIEKREDEMRKVKEEKKEKEIELKEKMSEMKLGYEDQITKLKDEFDSLKNEHHALKNYVSGVQTYNNQLLVDLTKERERFSVESKEKNELNNEIVQLKTSVSMLQLQNQSLQDKADSNMALSAISNQEKERLKFELDKVNSERDGLLDEISKLKAENAKYSEMTGLSSAQVERITNRATALEESFKSQGELISSLKRDLEIGKHRLELSEGIIEKKSDEVSNLTLTLEDMKMKLDKAEEQIRSGEIHRRKLHNTIQELKGNIRVFCRVRPLLENEEGNIEEGPVIQYPDSVDLNGRGIEIVQPIGRHGFTFDKVFGPTDTQSVVFEEIEQLIQSALDGYKVCIFAYGQTGSGKTYTMLGGLDNNSELGIIPRSLQQIFSSSQALVKQGWNFTMQVSMLEIYNESIRDLLANSQNATTTASDSNKYLIKHDSQGNTTVTDLTIENVCTVNEVNTLLDRAASVRASSKTALNERSSRSHCVFTLRISGTNSSMEKSVNGVLNLIDLAGSERLSKSNSTGDRLKETQHINKSLSALGDVICAIANRDSHIPFRNSKLTYLLLPCLGGDAKTLMFVNISPTQQSAHESLCSLRFASKVNSCELGVPRRNATSRLASAP